MASGEAYDYPRSRRYDDSIKTRRPRNDSTLDPDYHGFMYERSLYPPVSTTSRSRVSGSGEHSSVASTWPPPPTVEDEKESLAREINPEFVDHDDVPSRGTRDQDPILVDMPHHIPDRRFVWVPSASKPADGSQTPPTSDDERARRRDKRRRPKLETAGLPEMRREASPYAWTRPTPLTQTPGRVSGEFFLSPDSITPPNISHSQPLPAKQPPTSVPYPEDRWSQKPVAADVSPVRSASHQLYEGLGTADALQGTDHLNSRRAPSRYSWTKPDLTKEPLVHSSPSTPYHAPPFVSELSRRRPGSSEGFPSDYARRPAPPQVTTLQQSEKLPVRPRHPSESSQASFDAPLPLSQSRRSSSDRIIKDNSSPNMSSSRPTSRGGSHPSSPQPSPRIQHPASEYPWGSQFTSSTPRRSQPPSRLAESSVPRSPIPQQIVSSPYPHSPLPYPDDDRVYQTMPSERDHQYFPEQPSSLQPPFSEPVSRTSTPQRPSLSTRNSAINESSASTGASKSSRPGSSSNSSKTRASPVKMLPICSRTEPSTRYTDWYTLEGCLSFDICPYCLEAVFEGTSYRAFFKPSPPRPYNIPSKCEFSDPWIRLAWLLTSQRRLPTLALIMALANVAETEEPCPGRDEGVRNWYSIRDHDGHFVREFTVCPQDVKRLEILFPGFRGLFVPLPTRVSYGNNFDTLNHKCALRPEMNSRFAVYVDCLVSLHEAAVSAQRLPDTYDFVSLVRHKASIAECKRDDKQKGAYWHSIPTVAPAMTVCADCYDEVVVPHLRSDSDVAMRFNRSPQSVRGEGKLGLSCQLYSSRMRKMFKRAVEDNDMKYLSRKAKDRKEVEDGLQERCAEIKRHAERLKGRSGYAISSKAQQELERLQDELEVIGEEWAKWE